MIRIGTGFDIHPFGHGRKLVIGGVNVPHRAGLEGHSDADVLSHAVADALLGAIAAGDIGVHFPSSNPAIRGISSLVILAKAAELVRKAGGTINNVDSTVLAEEPKITPHVHAMRKAMSGALGIPAERISIKATTMEQMGPIGHKEGIAAMAVACVDIPEQAS